MPKPRRKRKPIERLAAHDLRRTCARLCHLAGGELEQIQLFVRACLNSNHRTLSWVQTKASVRRE